MRAGKLDRNITIQELTVTQDAQGEPVEAWADWAYVWAEVRDLRGREYFLAQSAQSAVDALFIIRHRDGLKHEMRISDDGVLYNIKGIARVGRNQGLEIQAVRVGP